MKPTPKMKDISESINKPKASIWWSIGLLAFFLTIFVFWGLTRFIEWDKTHQFHTEFPILVRLSYPIQVWERRPEIIKQTIPEYNGIVDTPIKKYICEKFGVMDCKIALGIVQAESNFNEQAWNINDNHTIDAGLWQINSVHFKQDGCSLKEVLDPIRATDCAYNIYKASGSKWSAWSTYLSGSYLASIDK